MKYILLLLVLAGAGHAEVRSITIGVDVNSPYGISEPWVTIRDGLLRHDTIEWVSPQPDRKSSTGELRTKGGQVPDVDTLAKALREIGAGASLRGVEAVVDGRLERQDGHFVLRTTKTDEVLGLEPASQRVHLDGKRPESLTQPELNSFKNLVAEWKNKPIRIRVTGSLLKRGDRTVLAVRQFVFQGVTEKEPTQ